MRRDPLPTLATPQDPIGAVRACVEQEAAGGDTTTTLRALVSAYAQSATAYTAPLDIPDTLHRFRWLSAACGQDLVLGKLFESHLDALSILNELPLPLQGQRWQHEVARSEGIWGVWAAEGPGVLQCTPAGEGTFTVSGRKSWCSGARRVSAALVTARGADGVSRLLAVPLAHAGVRITDEGWAAVGMAGTDSVDVLFDQVPAWPVGQAGDYVGRIGFWHGAAGIAACWHGAAAAMAAPLCRKLAQQGDAPDSLMAAHLGAVDATLRTSALVLRDAAIRIDIHRAGGADFGQREALAVRATVESTVQSVIDHVGRALGAGPLCRDAVHARRVADLGTFVRQSHAEWDLAALGRLVAGNCAALHTHKTGDTPWMP